MNILSDRPHISAPRFEHLIPARSAAQMLDVKLQTLYAYVSRGLIRAVPSVDKGGSMYYLEDIETLRLKGRGGTGSAESVDKMMRWGGGAVLYSGITSISEAGPSYRGYPSRDIAASGRPFEDCVELLWTGAMPDVTPTWKAAAPVGLFEALGGIYPTIANARNTRRLLSLTTEMHSLCQGNADGAEPCSPVLLGRQILQVLSCSLATLSGRQPVQIDGLSLSATVLAALGVSPEPKAVAAINAVLILCADHELAPATFAARIAASSGADLHACISTGLGALEGVDASLGCDQAECGLRSAVSTAEYVSAMKTLVRASQTLPGYNHPLYPGGDPRALFLIELVKNVGPAAAGRGDLTLDCIDAARVHFGAHPSLPVGIVAVCAALGLPSQSAGALMSLGRIAGWVAHVFEQRSAGFTVRPRARYVGPAC